MSEKNPEVDEQAAADAICAVEDLAALPEYEPNGRDTAPDWRVQCDDGRVADVEVMRSTDEDVAWFMESLSPDGSARVWLDVRLSFGWTIVVSDHSPAANRSLSLGKLMEAVRDVLVSVESHKGSLEQMKEKAHSELRIDQGVSRYLGYTRNVFVLKEPESLGEGNGWVRTYGAPVQTGWLYHERLVPLIQKCIDHKANGPWLDDAPDLKWLAVMPEGEPAWLFEDFFGPGSPSPRPGLEGVSLYGFDEVWVIIRTRIGRDNKEGFAVVRLSEGGARQQRRIVSRS